MDNIQWSPQKYIPAAANKCCQAMQTCYIAMKKTKKKSAISTLVNAYFIYFSITVKIGYKLDIGKFGQVWTSLDKFGQVWTSLSKFEQV